MGEIVSSAVVHETVNKIISGMIDKYERKSSAEEQIERLDMAQIKLEFALETSNKWQITSGPLLRWQKKLKRAAEECEDTLRKCRQRVQEEEEEEQQVVKTTMSTPRTRRTIRGARKAKLLRQQDHKTQHGTDAIFDFLNLWAVHAPVQLQDSLLDWIQKEKEAQLAPPAGVIRKNILMSEVAASAVIGEAVNRISTFLIDKHSQRSSDEDGLERLEMAHIKMEAALEVSSRWPLVVDASLLRWRKKLKRASDECSHVMDRCKRRSREDDEMEQEIGRCSFPKRIAHATRSFFSSFLADKDVDSLITTSTIKRFERFADGAGEFLRFMEFGSIRQNNCMLFDPLIGHLLAGEALQYESSHGNQYYLTARPIRFAERGLEAGVLLLYNNHEMPEKNFVLGILLRVTASTNVTGIVVRCLELLPTHFKPVAEAAMQELTQVHQRGFYCFPYVDSTDPRYWRIHHSETHRARPNPACCEGHEHHGRSRSSDMVEPSGTGTYPEPVIKLIVQRHVSARQKPSSSSSSSRHGATSLLQLTAVFAPHASPEQLPSGAESVAVVAINGREERAVHTNVGLREVEELLLPNAVDRLCHEAADVPSAHEVFWRSGHGVAYLCVEKMGTEVARCMPTHWRCKCGRAWHRRAQLWCGGGDGVVASVGTVGRSDGDGVVASGGGRTGGGKHERPTIDL
ncbi:hypothetical protein E2562_021826 [Oryza meyeriana var. granulata]|uniref:Rx N-terminal domain-containing protein n=1 Tax=Oryza meyeriana var. granulata TaxID=110450 RepID=A0A6G1ENB3_9ORYZ|nr:hypothetical protein E2562_021826 [Oryza meyeriana var. granulata]